jgi:uncharacterized protein YbjT (DUF2867 family)
MDIAIAGGHGQVALHLERQLAGAGHRARGIIRNPAHAADLEAAGAEPVVCDLEAPGDALIDAVAGADAVVFAAGAGPGSGPERKRTVDLGGALALIHAAGRAGVSRYVMVSSIGAEDPGRAAGAMGPYLQAKHEADQALVASGLAWTIVRPGRLVDDPGTGRVQVAERLPRGDVPREDVAAVLLGCLERLGTVGQAFTVLAGDVPVAEALDALGSPSGP